MTDTNKSNSIKVFGDKAKQIKVTVYECPYIGCNYKRCFRDRLNKHIDEVHQR